MALKVRKRLISVVASSICLFSMNLQALTLKNSVLEAMETNPVVQKDLKTLTKHNKI